MKDSTENWDLVIKPNSGWGATDFKELWRYRDLLWLFVLRDFKAQYKQTILGPLWHFIQPLFTTLMFLLVFTKIANIKTDGIPPTLFYMSGITIWNYFSSCLTATSTTFISNAAIFGKVYFPRLITPLSIIVSNLLRFVIQFFLLLAMMLFFMVKYQTSYFATTWLILPILVVLMSGISLGLGIIISSLTTKYRDLSVLLTFAIQLLMYATPIAYPMSEVANPNLSAVLSANPLSPVVEGFRYALFQKGHFQVEQLLYSFVFMVVCLFVGVILFNKTEKTFMDTV